MTADQYRAALAVLSLTQRKAAQAVQVSERTSRRFARDGGPDAILIMLADWEFMDACRTTIFNRHSGRTIRVAEGMA